MYELWDRESGNLVGEYASEAKAYSAVRRLQKHVGGAAESLSLGTVRDDGTPEVVASGRGLLTLASMNKPLPGLKAGPAIRLRSGKGLVARRGLAATTMCHVLGPGANSKRVSAKAARATITGTQPSKRTKKAP